MFQNLILIVLIILLLFFMSNEKKINDLFANKSIKYLFILLIIYFIYQQYNLSLLVIVLLVIIFLNVDMKNKFANNYESIKNVIAEYYSNFNSEKFSNNEESEEKKDLEPFRSEVIKLKDLYENIKLEIKKLA